MYFDESISEVYKRIYSSEDGITNEEETNRQKQGYNEIKKEHRSNPLIIFFNQFKNFLIILLIFAAIISFFLGDRIEFYGIIAIVLISTILGFIQEYRAEKAIEALEKISAPYARVLRNNIKMNIPAREIVVGDIVLLEEGDIVPADMRIIEESSLEIDESSLTGESIPTKKTTSQLKPNIQITEQKNIAFMGSIVSYGKGKGIVTNIGMNTEFGKIADNIQNTKETQTPLQKKFELLAQQIGFAVLGLVTLVFIFGIFGLDNSILELFLFSLSLAVAAVPSALPAIVTVSLGLGAKRLAKKNMIIKELPAAESLGSVTIICSDKTGTITKNQMTITKIFSNNKIINVSGTGYDPTGKLSTTYKDTIRELSDKELKYHELFLRTGYLCNNAKLIYDKTWNIVGDPTEGSLVVLAKKNRD